VVSFIVTCTPLRMLVNTTKGNATYWFWNRPDSEHPNFRVFARPLGGVNILTVQYADDEPTTISDVRVSDNDPSCMPRHPGPPVLWLFGTEARYNLGCNPVQVEIVTSRGTATYCDAFPQSRETRNARIIPDCY
jgi:hypothetical protein